LGVGSSAAGLNAQIAIFSSTDASSNLRFYRGVTGPGNFGPGAQTFVQATTAIGDAFYISGFEDSQFIAVGQNYVSGLALAATTTFANKSFATLGINPGEYVFTTPSDTVTLRFIAAPGPVPEPATWAMMLVGFGMIGAAVRRRQRTAITFA
jgi:hypothetical protein